MAASEVEGREAIRTVLASFAIATDVGTVDDYLSYLTDNSVLELEGRPSRNGIAELRAGAEAGRSAGALGPGSHTMHLLGGTQVTLEGERAKTVTPFVFFVTKDTGPTPAVIGHYHDELIFTNDGWKILHRRMVES